MQVRCELVNAPAHWAVHEQLANCRHPIPEVPAADQLRMSAELALDLADQQAAFTFTPISPNGYVDNDITVQADSYWAAAELAVKAARAKGLEVIDVMGDTIVITDEG